VVAVDPGKNWRLAPDTRGFVHNQLHPSLRSLHIAGFINILLLIPLQLSMAVVVLPWLWWCCYGCGVDRPCVITVSMVMATMSMVMGVEVHEQL